MSTGSRDLFIVCKNCGSEVSPYITECPYCGNRLRKRAPKLDRDGHIAERISRRQLTPSLPRLHRGEIPGIRYDSQPVATIVLVLLGVAGFLVWRIPQLSPIDFAAQNHLGGQWWRDLTALFVYINTGYALVALAVVAIYGTLLERRHGPVVVLVLFVVGGVASMIVAGRETSLFALGANGAGLTLLVAWAVPDLERLAHRHPVEGDLIGTAVLGAVLALMPLVTPFASWPAAGVGVIAGLALGYPLARVHAV